MRRVERTGCTLLMQVRHVFLRITDWVMQPASLDIVTTCLKDSRTMPHQIEINDAAVLCNGLSRETLCSTEFGREKRLDAVSPGARPRKHSGMRWQPERICCGGCHSGQSILRGLRHFAGVCGLPPAETV